MRRYTPETKDEAFQDFQDAKVCFTVLTFRDGTTCSGMTSNRGDAPDCHIARVLPLRIARGEVVPVPVEVPR
jgi:hypothetical protein